MVHLHVHTEGSTLDGKATVKEIVSRVKELGHTAVGITDHGNMIKTLEFQEECEKQGIKSIIGCEFYVGEQDSTNTYHLICLAKNQTGLRNLYKLNTFAYLKNFYYKPRITFEKLIEYKEGLIVSTACLGSEFGQGFIKSSQEELVNLINKYEYYFGDDFYLELQPNSIPKQKDYNKFLVEMSRYYNIPLIVTCDSHYARQEDSVAHDVMLAMQVKKKVDDTDRFRFTGTDYYLQDNLEICLSPAFKEISPRIIHEAMHNTDVIAKKCNAKIETGLNLMPHIQGIVDEDLELAKHCNVGFMHRVANCNMPMTQEYADRVRFELGIIKQKGYAGYFLIVEDYIKWAREQGITVGAGRGSGAGSLVNYILGITNVDPIKYGLLFERMLNPERNSSPDIDSDFSYERRNEVIEYVRNKYGYVAQIIAEGTMACNSVCRKVLGAYDYEQAYINQICKSIPSEPHITLEEAYSKSPEFKMYMDKHSKEYGIMKSLEGVMSHVSKHACGVIVCSEPIDNYAPCMRDEDNHELLKTQWEKKKLEKVGLYKFDFLAVKTLTILELTVKAIKRLHGVDVDIENIPLDDPKVYETLRSGDLAGIFQFDAPSGKQAIANIKPTVFDDIIAGESICRPGVKEANQYIINKAEGYELFGNKIVDDILKETHGTIVYQEQTMLLMNRLTGGRWTLGKADGMRKVKNLEEYREDFVSCCGANGIDNSTSNRIFDRFDLGYSFNKSHATAYAILSYQCAYLKTYYRKEFMSAVLTMELTATKPDTASHIKECKKYGIKLLPPDVNISTTRYEATEEGIMFPLTCIQNVGDKAVEEIIDKRPFISLIDMKNKVIKGKVNKKVITNLIKCGAIDSIERDFMGNRNTLLEWYYNLISEPKELLTWSNTIQMQYERELLGFCLTKHPLDDYNIMPYSDIEDGYVEVKGLMTNIKKIKDKKQNDMCFLTLESTVDSMECVIFSRNYPQYAQVLVDDIIVTVRGKKTGNKMIIDGMRVG